jgi:hypothetical protein
MSKMTEPNCELHDPRDAETCPNEILTLIEGLAKHVSRTEKTLWPIYQTFELQSNIEHLYYAQNASIGLNKIIKHLTTIEAHIKKAYDAELQKRVDAEEFEYENHIIEPVLKKVNRRVDEERLFQYYKPFFDKIIDAKKAILEKTYVPSIKDAETFMGALAEKVILPASEAIGGYEVRLREEA